MSRLLGLTLLLWCGLAGAAIDPYPFESAEQEARFRNLITELRCPKCQNQTIADSDAPLAKDLRQIVYDKIRAGESDQEIREFMKARYGDFILYKPPLQPGNYLLWFGPALVLLLVIGFAILRIRKRTPGGGS